MTKSNIIRLLIVSTLLMGASSTIQAAESKRTKTRSSRQTLQAVDKRLFEVSYYDQLNMFSSDDDVYTSAVAVLGTNRSGELSMGLSSPNIGTQMPGVYSANDWTLQSTHDQKLLLTLVFGHDQLVVEFYVDKDLVNDVGIMRMNVKKNTFSIYNPENPPRHRDLKFKGDQDVVISNMRFGDLDVSGGGLITQRNKDLTYEQAKAAFVKVLGRK